MALKVLLEQEKTVFTIVALLAYLVCKVICETGDCRQQEFKDRFGNCVLCKQCGPGMELSKECGFGYGEDAQCVTCRLHRFKEDWGFQKCKPCLDCAVVNRFQKANCSVTSDAVCGDCLPGFYRKTKLVGFQDMECVPCGDPPPPYEPHCTSKVNLVKIPSTASSPRDTALAAVICSALATVLLALLILCIIYCKRQFMEKKPSWSLRAQDIQYNGSELSCFDRPQLNNSAPRACCQCHRDLAQTCGPVHLIPSLCCDDSCSIDQVTLGCRVHSQATLQERNAGPVGETMPSFFGSLSQSICGEFSDAWPLMQNPIYGDDISFCDSYPELTGEDIYSLNPENESLDSNSSQDLVGGTVPIQAPSENFTETTDLFRYNSLTEPVRTQDALITRSQLGQTSGDIINRTTQTQTSLQGAF
ncbi:tumor necrosis factor receptor superfamily member 19 isoform X1 [Eptesicus fuscus]|uniref:tumor necrosis factor receptor superfamily member 19 isoform X1 n=2 Tax=Eptesicus fuscus TaxID=29078 RepID=UPI00101A6F05|nr:tumor necrosis factor receptor superfamily member 19 isoform X1 [Eptesicus fuscus]XP_027992131.1 tumor necrosis factor receptor superfamily member 19 isoform X1 [Eptesicus fuscus]XP_027992132.1 tumor necrosis factor receptor superfamily member 19 isoform X1 [Eptesicus fuscus]XP_054575718.1 tumor necrosis factor receptor superfamily member 19 isoform X1 [Eptesicus fuscus]